MASAIVRMCASTSKTIAPTLKLDTYEHSFFNADGTLHMVDTLDAKSGVASCTSYTSGEMKVRKSQLDVPADSFAGASGLMMMVTSLRHGSREIRFHAFACAPGPEIFSVKASLPDTVGALAAFTPAIFSGSTCGLISAP